MRSIKCGKIHNPSRGDNSGEKRLGKRLRRAKKERDAFHYGQREGGIRLSSSRARSDSQRLCSEDWQKNNSFGRTNQRSSPAGKIAGHLIDDCRNRIKRNNRQRTRNEQNIEFLKKQIAYLEQEQVELDSENEQLEAQIFDLQGIEDQMADPQ